MASIKTNKSINANTNDADFSVSGFNAFMASQKEVVAI